jgi:hypothetical protein
VEISSGLETAANSKPWPMQVAVTAITPAVADLLNSEDWPFEIRYAGTYGHSFLVSAALAQRSPTRVRQVRRVVRERDGGPRNHVSRVRNQTVRIARAVDNFLLKLGQTSGHERASVLRGVLSSR